MLYCGRLDPDKGIHKLMEAHRSKLHGAAHPAADRGQPLLCPHPAKQRSSASWSSRPRRLGDRVQFTGYIPNEDLPDYYRLADLVLRAHPGGGGRRAWWPWRPWPAAAPCWLPAAAVCPSIWPAARPCWWSAATTVTDQLAWSIRMLYEHPALCTEMGAAGAARGREFSTAHYYEEFVRIVRDVTENGGAQ